MDYVYDSLNRLTDIKLNGASTAAVHLDYDDLSRRTQLTYENGAECSYGYAMDNNLTSLAQTFTGSSVSFSFGYNRVYQTTEMTCDNNDFMWKPPVPSTTTYSPANNLNQYPAVGETAFGYDENGCLTSGPLTAYYDELNRLTQATVGEVTNDYWYDPLNRQAQKAVDSVKTRFLCDGLQLVEDYDDEDTLVSRYVPGDSLDEVFIKIEGSTKTYLHQDRLGSVIALSDDTGALQAAFNYGLFGETSSLTGTAFGYTGQRSDQEIGLYNYKARYYSPALGRFLQPDPIGFAGGMNLYAYVGNDPVNFTDPLGLKFIYTSNSAYNTQIDVALGKIVATGNQELIGMLMELENASTEIHFYPGSESRFWGGETQSKSGDRIDIRWTPDVWGDSQQPCGNIEIPPEEFLLHELAHARDLVEYGLGGLPTPLLPEAGPLKAENLYRSSAGLPGLRADYYAPVGLFRPPSNYVRKYYGLY